MCSKFGEDWSKMSPQSCPPSPDGHWTDTGRTHVTRVNLYAVQCYTLHWTDKLSYRTVCWNPSGGQRERLSLKRGCNALDPLALAPPVVSTQSKYSGQVIGLSVVYPDGISLYGINMSVATPSDGSRCYAPAGIDGSIQNRAHARPFVVSHRFSRCCCCCCCCC